MRHPKQIIKSKKAIPVKVWRSTFPGEARKYSVHAYLGQA